MPSEHIGFHTVSDMVHPFPKEEHTYRKWLNIVAQAEKITIHQLTYIFCSDEYLLSINQKYLQHDDYTDIITFPYKEGNEVEGDMFISLDRVKDNAATYKVDFYYELRRVMVHGLLHLIGYGDKDTDDIPLMRSKEDTYLDIFQTK